MSKQYWYNRSKNYNNLDWVKNLKGEKLFLKNCSSKKSYIIADCGCGTGNISKKLSPFVNSIHCCDKSLDMLKKINSKRKNILLYHKDMSSFSDMFPEDFFNIIICRMSLHHLATFNDLYAITRKFHRILKPKGKILIEEGIPTHNKIHYFYKNVFRLKEKRLVFTEKKLSKVLTKSGFRNINKEYYTSQIGLFNWLNYGGLKQNKIDQILHKYIFCSLSIKKYYGMIVKDNEIYINAKQLIISGEK